MSSPSTPSSTAASSSTMPRFREAPTRYAIVGGLLIVTVIALLAVPTYAHLTPTLGGIPFFYWYTLLWLVINAILQAVAYWVIRRPRPSVPAVPVGDTR